jgi:RHS repeat-associated protein
MEVVLTRTRAPLLSLLLASLAWLPGVAQADAGGRLSSLASVDTNTAFGETFKKTDPIQQRYTFAGREASSHASAGAPMFYRNRMYVPALGRFGRRDPKLGGDPLYNAYGFPRSNSVDFVDPMGEEPPKGWQRVGWLEAINPDEEYWRAIEQDADLRDLAESITHLRLDWQCIRPVSGIWDFPNYRESKANQCAVVSTTALRKSMNQDNNNGSVLRARGSGSSDDSFLARVAEFFGDPYTEGWSNGPEAVDVIRRRAEDGSNPIGRLVLIGHGDKPAVPYLSDDEGGHSFYVESMRRGQIPPTFGRAENGRFPLRCWFAQEARVYVVSCYGDLWTEKFAPIALRFRAAAFGSTETMGVRFWPPYRLFIHPDGGSYASKEAAFASGEWIIFHGRLW